MTGKMAKRAARAKGGWVAVPPITREGASEVLGAEIPLDAWGAISRAFDAYEWRKRALEASKASKKKDDPHGWVARQAAASKAIEIAMDKVNAALSKHGDFFGRGKRKLLNRNFWS